MRAQLRDWLAAHCGSTIEAAVVVLGQSAHAPAALLESWPPGTEPPARLTATVHNALERGRLSVQQARGARASTDVALPILRDGRVCGALGATLAGSDWKAEAERLRCALPSLLSLFDLNRERERLTDLLAAATTLLDHDRLATAAHAFSGVLAASLGCERVSIGLLRGSRVELLTLSNSVRFSDDSQAVRDLCAAMDEAIVQDIWVGLPVPEDTAESGLPIATHAHESLRRSSGARAVSTLPLGAHGCTVGAVTFEWATVDARDNADCELIPDLAALCGPMLELLARADAGPAARARDAWRLFAARHFGGQRLALTAVGFVLALVLMLAIVPGTHRISARANLEGRVQRALVAAVPGFIAEANARAGDVVEQGFVLARLDDRDLELARRKWLSQKEQLEREYREALAGRDGAQVSIVRAQIDQAHAELALAEESLSRTRVVAPFDGVVVEGDLDRSLGSPVELGSVLFEVAPLDGYRIIVEVDDRDIADVSVGQSGRLTLKALPNEVLALSVERVMPVSTTADGRNYFRVEAKLEQPLAALRPGMEGVAKIDVGERRLLWIWTHTLFDWLRLQLWSVLP